MSSLLTVDRNVQDLAVALVRAEGVVIRDPLPEQIKQSRAAADQVVAGGAEGGDGRRKAVRQLLRYGGFKPSGRNKPAQEYLLRAAGPDAQWPAILNAVDVLNVVSLGSGLPISLVALDRLQSPLVIRYGESGESFVFNQAGQTLDVEGLICICQTETRHTATGDTVPVGSPVKDSLLAKVTTADTDILACIFAPKSVLTAAQLREWGDALASGFSRWCEPQRVTCWLGPDCW